RSLTDTLYPPRISGGYNDIKDHAVTYGFIHASAHYIELGVVDFGSVTTSTNNFINNAPNILINQVNARPAISYMGDIIMVAWTYSDTDSTFIRDLDEILVKQYFPDGTPLTATNDEYSWLVDVNDAHVSTVSLSGRY